MKKTILISFILFVFSFSIGQSTYTSKIDRLFEQWSKSGEPGGSIGIIKEGKLIYAKGYGLADLEHQVPNEPGTVFYIGSVSKQFVTFCILLLEEQGLLHLDDRIQLYLPDFPEYEAPLTIRHFIHHTSGVRDYLTLMSLKGRSYLDHIDEGEVYELIKRQKVLNFKPGERYLYSNSCYFMLAMIVEKVSGQSLKEFAQEQIFGPLGMQHSKFHDDHKELIMNRAFSYEPNDTGWDNLISRFDLVGSGGVYSTVEDLYLWDQNFYNNILGKGGPTIIQKMHEEGRLNDGRSSGYAFALVNGKFKNLRTVRHSGALAGYRSELLRFPDEQFSVIILANRSDANPGSKAEDISLIYLADKMKETPHKIHVESPDLPKINLDPIHLGQFTGSYQVQTGIELELSVKEDTLYLLQKWNGVSFPLFPMNSAKFIETKDETTFEFDQLKENKAHRINIDMQGEHFKAYRKAPLDERKFNNFVGRYYGEELDVHYTISQPEKGELMLQIANQQPEKMKHLQGDYFSVNSMILSFNTINDTVSGFTLDAGRVQGLTFEKL